MQSRPVPLLPRQKFQKKEPLTIAIQTAITINIFPSLSTPDAENIQQPDAQDLISALFENLITIYCQNIRHISRSFIFISSSIL